MPRAQATPKPKVRKPSKVTKAEKKPSNVRLTQRNVLDCLTKADYPLAAVSILRRLEARPTQEKTLTTLLNALKEKLKVIDLNGCYAPLDPSRLIEGTIKTLRTGAGFILTDEPNQDDGFVPESAMTGLFNGDRVLGYRLTTADDGFRSEACVLRVLSKPPLVVGTVSRESGRWVVTPLRPEGSHCVLLSSLRQVKTGSVVVAEVSRRPTEPGGLANGRVVARLGDADAPGMAGNVIVAQHAIPSDFDTATQKAADAAGRARVSGRRKDLTDVPFFTIDDEQSRDLDDALAAVSVSGQGIRVYVAITDVSEFVKPKSRLDRMARERGTSVYLPDRVLPMLPPSLSEEALSLLPGKERAVLVAEFLIRPNGKASRPRFFEALIRSQLRFSYREVNELMSGRLRRPVPMPVLQSLADVIEGARAVEPTARPDIGHGDTNVRVDPATGKVHEVSICESTPAHKLVETWMVAVNQAAAAHLAEQGAPAVYRVQDGPDESERIEIASLLERHNIPAPTRWSAAEMRDLYEALAKHPKGADLARQVALRLPQARYSAEPGTHVGVAAEHYLHFTSPVRRYADLVNHRALKGLIRKRKIAPLDNDLDRDLTQKARRARAAERETTRTLLCQYVMDQIHRELDGTVVAVQKFGCFVRLNDFPGVEGLIHISRLGPEPFHFGSVGRCLSGEISGKVFRSGTPVRVRIAQVSPWEGRIDLECVLTAGERALIENKIRETECDDPPF